MKRIFLFIVTNIAVLLVLSVTLRLLGGLATEEIARLSGRSVSTIKASVFFALEKLPLDAACGAVHTRKRFRPGLGYAGA